MPGGLPESVRDGLRGLFRDLSRPKIFERFLVIRGQIAAARGAQNQFISRARRPPVSSIPESE